MQCQVSPWSVCSAELREAWSVITPRSPLASSPFLSWDFFESVSQVRPDVRVAVFRSAGAIVGCFPYQLRGAGRAGPVAGPINDLHGPLPEQLGREEFSEVLRSAGLSRFDFHAAPKTAWNSVGTVSYEIPACRMQLGSMAGDYVRHLYGSRYTIRQQKRKTRAMESKLGSIRMEWETRDDAILDKLLAWKSQQYRRTGAFDVFSMPWTRRLMRNLLHLESEELQGQMSALFAGDELVAVHFGLRRQSLLHCWFPAYAMTHARLSPGTEMFLRMADCAPAKGVTTLDLGVGDEHYKQKLSNESYPLVKGSLDLIPWRMKLRAFGLAAKLQARRLPLGSYVTRFARQLLAFQDQRRYQ
jgi:CelD/BcsL family acetyltransferase involved in cellulose biosynthesis